MPWTTLAISFFTTNMWSDVSVWPHNFPWHSHGSFKPSFVITYKCRVINSCTHIKFPTTLLYNHTISSLSSAIIAISGGGGGGGGEHLHKKWLGCAYQHIKSRGYQWQFSCKKEGHWVADTEKGVIGCENAQNPCNSYHFFSPNFCCDFQNFSKFDDFTRKFWSKNKTKLGVMSVKLWKMGTFGDKPMQKRGSIDRHMTYTS